MELACALWFFRLFSLQSMFCLLFLLINCFGWHFRIQRLENIWRVRQRRIYKEGKRERVADRQVYRLLKFLHFWPSVHMSAIDGCQRSVNLRTRVEAHTCLRATAVSSDWMQAVRSRQVSQCYCFSVISMQGFSQLQHLIRSHIYASV